MQHKIKLFWKMFGEDLGIDLMPKLAEWHIYGNGEQGRFVTRKPENNQTIYYLGGVSPDFADKLFSRILGFKEYEIKDHLGNVRVAITDYKLPINPDPTIQPRGVMPFAVDERAVNDYYPYGMLVKEKSWTSENYRYGYNGKENDNEVKGTGNSIDYGARIYDPRVARFFKKDPLQNFSASTGNYQYASNTPIMAIDEEGMLSRMNNMTPILTAIYKAAKLTKNGNEIINKIEYLQDISFIFGPFNNKTDRDDHIASFYHSVKSDPVNISNKSKFSNFDYLYQQDKLDSRINEIHLIGFNTNSLYNWKHVFGDIDINDITPDKITTQHILNFMDQIFGLIHEIESHWYLGQANRKDKLKSDKEHENYGNKEINLDNNFFQNMFISGLIKKNSPAYETGMQILNIPTNLIKNIMWDSVVQIQAENGKKWIDDTPLVPGHYEEIKE